MENKRMRELVDVLNKYAYEYYVLDAPTVSDKQYDELYDELKALESETGEVLFDSPTRRVGGDPVSAFSKHEHIARLYSLDKATSAEELSAFFQRVVKAAGYFPEFTVEYKFDGLTVCLTYDGGKFVRATTRGNGSVGEDVTAQILTVRSYPMKIGYEGLCEVKGEAVMRLSVLEEYNRTAAEPLKNARNAVAGAIRNLDPKETERRKPEILFYDVNYTADGVVSSQLQGIDFLKKNGFKVFDYLRVCKTEEEVLAAVDEIEKGRKELDVLTDGVVIKVNDFSVREMLGATEKFPRWAIAYKFEPEETTTVLRDVVWQVGRTGKLTPLAVLDPVELCGVTVRRATLNNFGDVERKKVKINSRVLIHRSNEVIPEILGTTEYLADSRDVEKPATCPECGTPIEEIGANLFCPNKDCKKRVVLSLANFSSKEAMNIEGFSEATAVVLYDNFGVRRFSDLYKLNRDDLLKLEGFQDKKADNLLAALEKSKNSELGKFIFALGIDGVGKKTAKDLAKKFKSLENIASATLEDILSVKDVGSVIADNVFRYFADPDNLAELKRLEEAGVVAGYADKTVGDTFKGEKVVLTGTLEKYKRSEAQRIIESLGGEICGSVSKLTTIVLAGAEAGSKLDKAKALGIRIMDESEFDKLINK